MIRIVAFFDLDTHDLEQAYKQLFNGLLEAGLNWGSSGEWYDNNGSQGDSKKFNQARSNFMLDMRKKREDEISPCDRLVSYVEHNDLSHLLDDYVHDVKSNEAININNDGPASQIGYLLSAGIDLNYIKDRVTKEEEEGEENIGSQETHEHVGDAESAPESD